MSATFPDPHKLSPGEEDDCAVLLGAWARSLSSTSSLISPLFSSPFLAERELSFGAKRDERARALLLEGNGKCARAGREEVDAKWKPAEAGVHLSGEARPGSRLLLTPPRVRGCCGAAAAAAATVSQSVEHPDPRLWRGGPRSCGLRRGRAIPPSLSLRALARSRRLAARLALLSFC